MNKPVPPGKAPEAATQTPEATALRALCDCCAQLLLLGPDAETREALADFIERARHSQGAGIGLLSEYVDLQRRALTGKVPGAQQQGPSSLEGLPVYSTVGDAIEGALLRLLAQEAVASVAPQQLLSLQKQIEQGINWYELAACLATLADWFADWRGSGADRITGLPAGDALRRHLQLELERLKRFGQAFCLVHLEIAHYTDLVEQFGEAAAAKALHLVARIVQGSLRAADFCGRGEGAALLLVLPATGAGEAVELVEDIAALVQRSPFHFAGRRVEVGLAYGMAEPTPGDTFEGVRQRAAANQRLAHPGL